MSPLFRFMMRRHRWTCGLCLIIPLGLGVVFGIIYPMFERERAAFGPMFSVFRKWFSNLPDFLSPDGAFVWPFMHPLTLMIYGLAPAIPAIALPSGERGRGSLDLLLATPLSRKRMILTVVAFMAPVCAAMALAPFVGALIGASMAGVTGQVPFGAYGLASVEAFALSFCLGAFALLLSVRSRDRGQATLRFAVTCFAMFVVDFIAVVWKGHGPLLKRCGPLGYYHPLELARGETHLIVVDLIVLLGAASAFVGCAVISQSRRRSA